MNKKSPVTTDSISARQKEQPIRLLFADTIATEESSIDSAQGTLYAEEEAYIQGAVEKRKREFRAGRCCARKALKRLGLEGGSIPVKEDLSPLWPEGIVGSITHTRDYCGVAVGFQEKVGSIGLDIEQVERVGLNLWDLIFIEEEQSWLYQHPAPARKKWGALFFSVKECFYKYQYPLTGRFLGFEQVTVSLQPKKEEFQIHLLVDLAENFRRNYFFRGRFKFYKQYVITAMAGEYAV